MIFFAEQFKAVAQEPIPKLASDLSEHYLQLRAPEFEDLPSFEID